MMFDAPKAASLLDAMCHKSVLVIGDLMLDRFIDGQVDRISPEAPVPVLSKTTTMAMPGGAANVARNLCHLGVKTILTGIVGKDASGLALADELSSVAGLLYQPVMDEARPTTTKTRFRAGVQQILRVDDEVKDDITQTLEATLLDIVETHISQCDVIVLSDYAKGCLTRTLTQSIISLAKSHHKQVIADPKSQDFGKYQGASLLTPNLSELKQATPLQSDSNDDITAAVSDLCERHHIDNILTTLSARGMLLAGTAPAHHLPTIAKDVFDVSGAGDTVVASLAAARAAGASHIDAMQFATIAAGIVVSKPGTASLTAGEFLTACPSDTSPLTRQDTKELCEKWRAENALIGFTNGCFDLLHPGHLFALREAAKGCDKLIVAVNSDDSVKRLKGPTRPSQADIVRASNIAQLPFVDAVVIFEEDTPLSVIEALTPDRLIKGGDYKAEDIVGYDHVIENGGQVVTIPLLEGHSTTAILKD